MAIVAGAFQNRLDLRRNFHVRFQAARRYDGRIRPARLNQLDENENSNRASHSPFRPDTFHGRISPDSLELKFAGAMQPRASGKFAERLWKTVPGASMNCMNLKT
jgi:hypothetical protein